MSKERFLLVFTMAAACLSGITAFAVDLSHSLQGSSRKLQEPEPGNNADDGRKDALVTKDKSFHSFPEPVDNNTNLETVKTDSRKSKLRERRDKKIKESGKVVVKRNAGHSNTTTTTSVASSFASTHAPDTSQVTPISSHPAHVANPGNNVYPQRIHPGYNPVLQQGFPPGYQSDYQLGIHPVPVYGAPQAAQKTEEEKKTASYDYTNILAIVSGGGLVSVAKAVQSFFTKKKEKKEKQKKKGKKGKRQKRDSESSHSDSGSESEEDKPATTVAVHIEMKAPPKVDPASAKKKTDSVPADKKTDSLPAITD